MPPPSRLRRWVLTAVLLGAVSGAVAVAHASPRQASVLVLLPGQPGLPSASLIATGIRSTLIGEWSVRVSIETELVDVYRLPSLDEEERRLRALVPVKYRDRTFDVVITASSSPLRVALRLRDELWPGVPVIACGLDERALGSLTLPPGVTVPTVRFDMEGTLRAALALLPDTRRVALVGGAAPQDKFMHDLARGAIRESGRSLELIDLTALPIVDLMSRVAVLPEQTVVLVSSYQMDAGGRRLYGLEIVEPLANVANRPAFNMFQQVLGRGVVGGSMLDFEEIGREAGTLALKVLGGETLPSGRLPSTVVSVPRFDGRQLARWHLDERRLPPGSELINPEPTLWRYRWHFAGALMLVGMQAALIAALLVERHQRREAQARLAERLRFEALVTEIGAALTVMPPSRLDEQLRECLRRVVTFLRVDFGALWRPAGRGLFEASYVWSAPDVVSPTAIDTRRFRYFGTLLEPVGGTVSFTSLDELPPEAATERAACEAAGIRSLVIVAMHADDRALGHLMFATLRAERPWTADVMRQLGILAEYFANPIVRAQDAASLESSAALTDAVLAALPGETALLDADGTIVRTNEAWAIAARRLPESAAQALFVGANYLKSCRDSGVMPAHHAGSAAAGIESVLFGGRHDFSMEYPTSRFGQDRWFELRVRRVAHLGGGAAVMHLDVTKRRQDEAAAQHGLNELAHLDRVAAMGTLASSIAHELNQPLAAILTNAQAARRFLAGAPADLEEAKACLADIITDDQRAADVIRHMRRLLRKTEAAAAPIALNDLVATTIGLVSNEALMHAVSIEFAPAIALPIVHGDPVQVQQVVLNLLTNAITAAEPSLARKVSVWTATMPSPYVEIGVHDSGPGILESDLRRVFEPFFTTKAEGLGMGLAISQRIVDAHGGQLMAENDPAGGTTFRLHLRTDTLRIAER
jgi:signal transduction histidine kinase